MHPYHLTLKLNRSEALKGGFDIDKVIDKIGSFTRAGFNTRLLEESEAFHARMDMVIGRVGRLLADGAWRASSAE